MRTLGFILPLSVNAHKIRIMLDSVKNAPARRALNGGGFGVVPPVNALEGEETVHIALDLEEVFDRNSSR